MYSRQMIAVVAILCATGSLQAQNTAAQGKNAKSGLRIHAYKNGHWFDGKTFSAAKSLYSVNGILYPNRPFKVDEEVDLKGAYVIPARRTTTILPATTTAPSMLISRAGFSTSRTRAICRRCAKALASTVPRALM